MCSVDVVAKKLRVQEVHRTSSHGSQRETNIFLIENAKRFEMQLVDTHFRNNIDATSASITTFTGTLDLVCSRSCMDDGVHAWNILILSLCVDLRIQKYY